MKYLWHFGETNVLFYDLILQGDDTSVDNAIALAQCGAALSESAIVEQKIRYLKFIDTINGVEIYYDYGADYYCFAPEAD